MSKLKWESSKSIEAKEVKRGLQYSHWHWWLMSYSFSKTTLVFPGSIIFGWFGECSYVSRQVRSKKSWRCVPEDDSRIIPPLQQQLHQPGSEVDRVLLMPLSFDPFFWTLAPFLNDHRFSCKICKDYLSNYSLNIYCITHMQFYHWPSESSFGFWVRFSLWCMMAKFVLCFILW